ncbi:armadillo-type protein [Halteromyces radiatus]|uniref:armadillo-type protein n=1 Tax=Halteromyces radiatus TaxID=101107 RepID=UPI00221E7441|nr:armadillo-type protein [Halteromyces radiatus]KAI8093732.1 armadillo-type protein [Halteromyces radiatus]
MGLWPVLIQLLSDDEQQVRTGVAWVCGTALQNNPDAQKAFLEQKGLTPLIKLLSSDQKTERAKAQYAISGLLKHCPTAVEEFKSMNGFQIMANILKNSADDTPTVRKVIFLYNTLMIENPSLAEELVKDGMVKVLDDVIVKYTIEDDEDLVEKALRTLHTLAEHQSFSIVNDDMRAHIKSAKEKFGADNLNLDKKEWDDLLSTIS